MDATLLGSRATTWSPDHAHALEADPPNTSFTSPRERTAQAFLRERLRTAGTPTFVPPQAQRVRFEDLMDLMRSDHARKGNRSRLEHRLTHLAAVFAGDAALAITTDRIDRYADTRVADGAKPATVNRELAALRHALRVTVRKQLLPAMPVVTLLPEDNVREGFIDPPEFARLLAALRDRDAAAVADAAEFAYLTCLRRGNALGALWRWFTLTTDANGAVVGGGVRLPGAVTKNKQPLVLALTGQLLALIARRWTLRVAECPFVFHREGGRLGRFNAAWNAACAAVGLPRMLFHDLRRSGARNYRRAGVDEDVIQRIGGWKTASMFARYNVVDERDLADAGERLSAFLAAAATAPPTVLPLEPARRTRRGGAHGQYTDIRCDDTTPPRPAGAPKCAERRG
jgi:integrase